MIWNEIKDGIFIICRNCSSKSVNNYYGFCSLSCLHEYAHTHGFLDSEVQAYYELESEGSSYAHQQIKDLELEIESLKNENLSIEEEVRSQYDWRKEEFRRLIDRVDCLRDEIQRLNKRNSRLKKKLERRTCRLRQYEKQVEAWRKDSIRFELMDL